MPSRQAATIGELGRYLDKRLATLGEHFAKLGGSLDNATRAYNQAVGGLEGRVFVTARRFRELGAMAGGAELPLAGQVEQTARLLQAEEVRTEMPSKNRDGDLAPLGSTPGEPDEPAQQATL